MAGQPYRPPRRRQPSVSDLVSGVLAADPVALGRAITLVESDRPDHLDRAQEMLQRLLPRTGAARRVGLSGPPGVGKSTFIEALGVHLLDAGKRVAVLAVDPSSDRSGGSIMGDKTRMVRLAADPRAFVRPSPSGGTLGGVHRKTREAILVCEAAGFDVVMVETVGVGQSETRVAGMVDTFVLLMMAGAGDELQGIKRGIVERAEVIVVNKDDGDNRAAATRAAATYRSAVRFLPPTSPGWTTPVLTCSGLEGRGLPELWEAVEAHRVHLESTGGIPARRSRQRLDWLWAVVRSELGRWVQAEPRVQAVLPAVEADVLAGRLTALGGARRLLRALDLQARSDANSRRT